MNLKSKEGKKKTKMVSGSSDSNKDKRVEVLKLIQDKKDILFCNSIPTGDKNAVILDKVSAQLSLVQFIFDLFSNSTPYFTMTNNSIWPGKM